MVARRFKAHFGIDPTTAIGLPESHRAVVNARTLFPSTVVEADDSPRIFVSGANQRKIGDRVRRGLRWSGMPIYCITLEERATCPRSCHHWRSCYGNGMPLSRRHAPGPALERKIERELAAKQRQHPTGFVVRLHILGDFYSAEYARLWAKWMATFPALRVFGYTAHPRDSVVGTEIERMNVANPGRSYIRFSSQALDGRPGWATTIWSKPETPTVDGAIVCPAQTGRTDCCGTCALCWSTPKTIAFIAHGQRFKQLEAA